MNTFTVTRGARLLGRQFPSQKEAAAALGISASHLSSLIWGRKIPSVPLAAKIEARYGIPVSAWVREEKESAA